MKIVIYVLAYIAVASAAKKYAKPLHETFSDFLNEPDIHLITEEEPEHILRNTFTGNVMQAQITSIKSSNHGKKFNYNFETQNGINIASIGKLKDEKTFVVSGSYSYTGADGKRYRVRYTADELGYHPVTELEEIEPVEIKPPVKSERTGKSFGQNEFVFNKNFLKSEPLTEKTLSRLYLPVTESPREYLPPSPVTNNRIQVYNPTYQLPTPAPLPALPALPALPNLTILQVPTESKLNIENLREYLPPYNNNDI